MVRWAHADTPSGFLLFLMLTWFHLCLGFIGHNFVDLLAEAFVCVSRSWLQLVPKLTRNFLKEGYMEKTGPRASGADTYCPCFQKMILNVYQPKEMCQFCQSNFTLLECLTQHSARGYFCFVLVLMPFHLLLILSIFFTFCIFVIIRSSCLTLSFNLLQQTEGFKKRWFTLDQRRLMYFKDPLVGQPWIYVHTYFRKSRGAKSKTSQEIYCNHTNCGKSERIKNTKTSIWNKCKRCNDFFTEMCSDKCARPLEVSTSHS